MRLTKVLAILVILPGAMLCAAGSIAQSQPQESVADAARQARERKKNEPKAAKVITNDDLAAASPAGSGTQPGTAAPTSAETPATAEEQTTVPASEDKGEQYWRKRFADASAELALAEKELDVLQREWQRDQRQFYADPQKAMQEQHDRKELNDRTAAIEAKKKQVEQLKQKISDLEDELRAAGGDSGWAR
jgi:predicted RNase H-like nuclease (RuvC/YqgF family)